MACVLEALAAVVSDGGELRQLQAGDVVHDRRADRGVEAALALAGAVHVPHAEAAIEQPVAARAVAVCARRKQGVGPEGLQDLPELILGMRIVLLPLERLDARKATEDEHTCVGRDDGRKAGQHRGGAGGDGRGRDGGRFHGRYLGIAARRA
ncbi:hypothetical protein D9M69_605640 [compost metagenome]